jgi:ferrous iron transport protein B
MDCHQSTGEYTEGSDVNTKENKKPRDSHERIVLVGTPNVGKSVIFGLLTGKYATVSNYPGTTVEVSYANTTINEKPFLLVDTPGANSLLPMSEDEQVTRDILLAERPAKVLQVGDTKNLVRTLGITIQLAEMGLPMVLDLNMEDEATERGINVDSSALGKILGINVVSTVAPEKRGIKDMKSALVSEGGVPEVGLRYPALIEKYIDLVKELLPKSNISRRSLAVMVLSKDETLKSWLTGSVENHVTEEIERLRADCRMQYGQSIAAAISKARIKRATEIAEVVTTREQVEGSTFLKWIGDKSMHPVWGAPILLLVLYFLYQFVGILGADILVGFVEETLFGEYINPVLIKTVETIIPIAFFRDMLVGEYGIITMALTYAIGIILPITTTFFLAFSVLEDSGYLPRLAIMSNRIFNIMGLSGKAVLPMVLGLGCGTMAVMITRVLETKRDRLIATFLLALAVPCAAQLGVIMGMIGSLSAKALMIWAGVIVGLLLFTGYLASLIIPGDRSDFMLEIPPIRMPSILNVLKKTGNRVLWYLKEAVPLFIYGTLVLFFLDKISMLGVLENALSPVIVGVLGLPKAATGAFLIGFFRRDYGAAGLFALSSDGLLDPVQVVVSLVTLTLFVPCLAHFLMMIKERGARTSLIMLAVIIPTALTVGGILNWVLRAFNISLT